LDIEEWKDAKDIMQKKTGLLGLMRMQMQCTLIVKAAQQTFV
jgi:hypothetical protein